MVEIENEGSQSRHGSLALGKNKERGVRPVSSVAEMSAPAASSICTLTICLDAQAACRGVRELDDLASMLTREPQFSSILSALSLPSAAATWRDVSKLPRLLIAAEEEEEEEEEKEEALIPPPPLFAAVNPPPPMDRPAFVARVISYRMFKSIGRPVIDEDEG